MSFVEEASVALVVEETAGSELASSASAGATSITVVDGSDFDVDDGGQLIIDDEIVDYSVDDPDEPETLTVTALAGAHSAEAPVLIYPLAVERFAEVVTPESDEPLVCRVPHALYERLDIGIRGEDEGASTPTYPELVVADGAELYWALDDATGGDDLSGNGRDAIPGAGVTIGSSSLEPAGFATGSTDFDGTASNDNVGSPLTYSGMNPEATFEGWAYRDQDAGWMGLVGPNPITDTEILIHYGSTEVAFRVNGTAVSWPGAWPGNTQWVHFALTFDEAANVAELFINGVSKGTKTQAGNWPAASGYNLQIGYHGYSGGFDGKMAHFAVYDYALSSDQILAHYETGAGLVEEVVTLPVIKPEQVEVTLDADEWVVTDILDKAPEAVARGAVGDGRWELDEAGFRLYSGEDELLVNLPTDEAASPFFAGVLAALGLDLPAGDTDTPPDESKTRWLNVDDELVASDTAYETAGYRTRESRVEKDAGTGAIDTVIRFVRSLTDRFASATLEVPVGDSVGAWGLKLAEVTEGQHLPESSWLLRPGSSGPGATWGVEQVPMSGGALGTLNNISHGLGETPGLVIATCSFTLGVASNRVFAMVGNLDSDSFDLRVRTNDGSNLSGNVHVRWLAIA